MACVKQYVYTTRERAARAYFVYRARVMRIGLCTWHIHTVYADCATNNRTMKNVYMRKYACIQRLAFDISNRHSYIKNVNKGNIVERIVQREQK